MRRPALILPAALLLLTLPGCAEDRPTSVPPTPSWEGTAASCSAPTEWDADPILGLDAGQIVELTNPQDQLRAAQCGTADTGDSIPVASDDDTSTWFAVGTGSDREGVALTETSGGTITVEHTRPGDGCGTTDEWRGRLALIAHSLTGAEKPEVEFETVGLEC